MATATAPVIGTVSSIVGQAFARDPSGRLRPLKVGDVLREGEVLVLAEGAHVELEDASGALFVPRTAEILESGVSQPAAAATRSPAGGSEEIDRVIQSLEPGSANDEDAPAAGLNADAAGSEGLPPGLRVERVAETVEGQRLSLPASPQESSGAEPESTQRPVVASVRPAPEGDTEAPTVTIMPGHSLLPSGGSTSITFEFSEPVSGLTVDAILTTGGILSNLVQTGPSTWTATFTQAGTEAPSISIVGGSYTDLAGNAGAGASLAMTADTAAPTLTITAADTLLAAGESTTVTFSFSEPVTGFDASDITVTGGTLSGLTQTGPSTWTATFTQSGTDAPSIAVGAGSYTDVSGNAGTGASLAMTADTGAPTLSITAADTLLAAGESTTVTFTFSEAVSGFDVSDITVTGGTLSGLTTSDNITWTATFTQSGTDAPSIAVAGGSYTDVAGNAGTGASLAMTADTAAPTLSITAADTLLAAGESTTVTFTFSEAVSGFDVSDITVTGGTLLGLTTSDNITWTATFTQSGTDAPSIAVGTGSYTDLAGNAGAGASLTLSADTAAPTLTITAADTLLAAGESTTVTFSFSEPVTGFDASDITVTGGSISGLTQTGPSTWTATFTQSGTDTPSIAVGTGSYTDLAGNAGAGASLALSADTAAPTLTITAADTLLAAGESTTVTFSFSEPVTGFDASDITVTGGTLSGLTQTGPSTWTATFTQSGTDAPSIAVGAGSYTDVSGNAGTGASLAMTADTGAPTLSITAADTLLAAGESTTVTFTFSEAVSGFDVSDITVTGGTLSGLTTSDNITWTATFTQSGTDAPSIAVAGGSYTDVAGNAGTGASLAMTADTAAPTLSITAADTLLAAGESTTVTFTFSEAVSGFDVSDITVTGGTL
ncbi:retention module-containing protein, partial [Caldimonas sp.]|uniref:retention module-containing protein n=1 Tax=Caldimonas sp. TaxID=2838790 RepID=UPI0039188791